jgi:hypothetical protein
MAFFPQRAFRTQLKCHLFRGTFPNYTVYPFLPYLPPLGLLWFLCRPALFEPCWPLRGISTACFLQPDLGTYLQKSLGLQTTENLPRVSAKGSAALDLFSSDSKEETQSPGVHVGSGLAQVCLLCELQNNGEHACPESRLTREKPGLSHHTLQPDNYFFFGVRMDRRRLVVEYQGLQLNVIIIS